MSNLETFANNLHRELACYLAPAEVSFRGSIASGTYDSYSDVDLFASVQVPLDNPFYSSLEEHLISLYGPALIRYDPEDRPNPRVQTMFITFYQLPLFWRLDLTLHSGIHTEKKFPDPFPSWNPCISALMNILWAVKSEKRHQIHIANHHLSCACAKLSIQPFPYDAGRLRDMLKEIMNRPDSDWVLVDKLIRELS